MNQGSLNHLLKDNKAKIQEWPEWLRKEKPTYIERLEQALERRIENCCEPDGAPDGGFKPCSLCVSDNTLLREGKETKEALKGVVDALEEAMVNLKSYEHVFENEDWKEYNGKEALTAIQFTINKLRNMGVKSE